MNVDSLFSSKSTQIAKGTPSIKTEKKPHLKSWNSAYFFIAPFLILYLIFTLLPIFQGLWISLHNWEITGTNIRFVGLDNYARIFRDPLFWTAFSNTLYFVLIYSPVVVAIGLGFALLLNMKLPGSSLYRATLYLPAVASVTAVGLIWSVFMSSTPDGLFNQILAPFLSEPTQWLQSPDLAMPSIIVISIWWGCGGAMLILLAALQDIPQELYDAAKVDGARTFDLFYHITIPGLTRALGFVSILNIIAAFQLFGQVDVITHGGPGGATKTLVYYMYETSFTNWQLGRGSAAAFILFIILLGVSLIQLRYFLQREKVLN